MGGSCAEQRDLGDDRGQDEISQAYQRHVMEGDGGASGLPQDAEGLDTQVGPPVDRRRG